MKEGDRVKLSAVIPSQHFTEPPPRFTEASLVKALEEYGIGRPSTYASIISTLRDREYVDIESRRFTADRHRQDRQPLPHAVLHHLRRLRLHREDGETRSTRVATGEQEWVPLLDRFWKPFIKLVKHTETSVSREEVAMARDLGHRPRERQADERAHGPLRTLRADRHQGRRGEAALRGPAARPKDGRHHARGGAVPVPAAAQARTDAPRARRSRQHRPLRTLREIRREVRLAQDRRSLHRHAGARARGDPREGDRRRQPPDPGFSGRRHPGAQRPLRTLHHGQDPQRQDSEGPRPEEPDTRGVPGTVGGGTRTRASATSGDARTPRVVRPQRPTAHPPRRIRRPPRPKRPARARRPLRPLPQRRRRRCARPRGSPRRDRKRPPRSGRPPKLRPRLRPPPRRSAGRANAHGRHLGNAGGSVRDGCGGGAPLSARFA